MKHLLLCLLVLRIMNYLSMNVYKSDAFSDNETNDTCRNLKNAQTESNGCTPSKETRKHTLHKGQRIYIHTDRHRIDVAFLTAKHKQTNHNRSNDK